MFFQTRKRLLANLFTKEEDLKKSAPFIGFQILKLLQLCEDNQISIFDVAKNLRKTNNFSIRSIYYGMLFLYSFAV